MPYELTHAERLRYKRSQDAAYHAGEEAVTNLQAALSLMRPDPALALQRRTGRLPRSRPARGCSTDVANRLAEVIAAGAHALQGEHL